MTEAKHTKEPWTIELDGKWSSIHGSNGKMVIPSITNSKADHVRIVACVNACAGIATENLEAITLSDYPLQMRELQDSFEASQCRSADRIADLERQLSEAQHQNRELREAIGKWCTTPELKEWFTEYCNGLDEALGQGG